MSDPNTELLSAVNANKLEAVRAMVKNPKVDVNCHNCLHWAVTFGKEEMSKLLIENGADVNKRGMAGQDTPLLIALSHSKPNIVEYLLHHGADPNIGSLGSNQYPLDFAYTPITLDLLLKHGAIVNVSTKTGHSFLFKALHRLDILERLLQAGADVNVTDKDGYTPLIMAVEQGVDDAIKLLLRYGADIEVLGPSGRTVHEIATKPSTRKILEAHRPAPIPITKISACDQVVEPAKIIDSSDAALSPTSTSQPHRRRSWIGKMFGSKTDSNSSPTSSITPAVPIGKEGLFAMRRRMKQSGLSPEEWYREEVKRGAIAPSALDPPTTPPTSPTYTTKQSSAAEPSVATAYVTPTTITADIPNVTADIPNDNTATPTTATLATTQSESEYTERLEARILKLERVVEDQGALIAKLLKIVDVKAAVKA